MKTYTIHLLVKNEKGLMLTLSEAFQNVVYTDLKVARTYAVQMRNIFRQMAVEINERHLIVISTNQDADHIVYEWTV